jgi:hypothetical protein
VRDLRTPVQVYPFIRYVDLAFTLCNEQPTLVQRIWIDVVDVRTGNRAGGFIHGGGMGKAMNSCPKAPQVPLAILTSSLMS